MGLHDRISGRNGNGAAAEADHSSYAAPQRDEASERTGPVDPYAELKTRIHHACIAKLGPELFKKETTEDLSERVLRAVTEQLALPRPPPTRAPPARGAAANHAPHPRRHPRLRAARAAPPGRLDHRSHGQRLRPDLH